MCVQTTFIYEGHCYTSCPEHAYMLPEKPNNSINFTSDLDTARLHERAVLPNIPQKKCGKCHESCLRCRGPSNADCTECTSESKYREITSNETYCDTDEHDAGSPQIINIFDPHLNYTNQNSHASIVQIFQHSSISTTLISIASVTIILFTIYLTCKLCGDDKITTTTTTTSALNNKKNYAYNRIAFDGNDQIALEQEIMIHASDSSEEADSLK